MSALPMGQNTEMRRFRGFGDTTFAMAGADSVVASSATPLPEVAYTLDVQGQTERVWRVQHFELTEALSAPYEAVLDVASDTFTDNPDLMLGCYALLTLQRGPVSRRVYGVVRRVEQRGATGSHRLARLVMVPSLWALSQRSDARIFQNVTAVEVVQQVLAAAGLYVGMLQLALTREYPRREYCVQYDESDLAFVARLLASEGITWFFRHDLDGTEALVLTDSAAAWLTLQTMDGGAVPIAGAEMVTHAVETVRNLTWQREQRPASVAVRDFDFTRPGLRIEAMAPRRVEHRALFLPAPALTITQYEGTAYTLDDAKEQAQMRLEAEATPGAVGQGEGLVTGMVPGATFAVTLAGGYIPDQRYLVTRVTHAGDAQEELLLASEREALADQRYRNRFECVLVDAPWRPARTTPKPVIGGVQTATVVGPVGEEVYTDSHGRIRVQFHWDRYGARDERASCWIRAVQGPWAGGGFGFQFLPRVGMEVVVTFVDGDPDRPLVLGTVFNGLNVPPYELPSQRTRSGLRTQSLGGVGYNELSFEDAAGVEQVRLHAQRNLDIHVGRDRNAHVSRDDVTTVAGNISVTGASEAAVQVAAGITLTADRVAVAAAADVHTIAGRDLVETIGRSRVESVRESLRQEINADHTEQLGGYLTTFVGRDRDLTVQGDDLEAVWGDRAIEVKGDLRERVAGDASREVEGTIVLAGRRDVRIRAEDSVRITCGQSVLEMTRDAVIIRAPTVRVESTELASIASAGADMTLDGTDARLRAADELELRGRDVLVAAKNARATLGSDGVSLAARDTLSLEGGGASVKLDGQATVLGTHVKLGSGHATSTFRSRIGSLTPGDEVHVLATQLVSPGGVPLADEYVEIIDARTDIALGAPVRTNGRGELRVEVPHPGPWDLRLLHDDHEESAQGDDHEAAWELHARFVNHRGEGLEGLRVTVRGATEAEVVTDADGGLQMDASPGPYTLEVEATDISEPCGFYAHATRVSDRVMGGEQSYVFVIEPDEPEVSEDLRGHRGEHHDHDDAEEVG